MSKGQGQATHTYLIEEQLRKGADGADCEAKDGQIESAEDKADCQRLALKQQNVRKEEQDEQHGQHIVADTFAWQSIDQQQIFHNQLLLSNERLEPHFFSGCGHFRRPLQTMRNGAGSNAQQIHRQNDDEHVDDEVECTGEDGDERDEGGRNREQVIPAPAERPVRMVKAAQYHHVGCHDRNGNCHNTDPLDEASQKQMASDQTRQNEHGLLQVLLSMKDKDEPAHVLRTDVQVEATRHEQTEMDPHDADVEQTLQETGGDLLFVRVHVQVMAGKHHQSSGLAHFDKLKYIVRSTNQLMCAVDHNLLTVKKARGQIGQIEQSSQQIRTTRIRFFDLLI
jgi:hypothetical protein